MLDYYELLEVSQRASKEVIERAYRVLAQRWHPDSNPKELNIECTVMMQNLNEAHHVLTNESRRKEYDILLKLSNSDQILKDDTNYASDVGQNGNGSKTYEADYKNLRNRKLRISVYLMVIIVFISLIIVASLNLFGSDNEKGKETSSYLIRQNVMPTTIAFQNKSQSMPVSTSPYNTEHIETEINKEITFALNYDTYNKEASVTDIYIKQNGSSVDYKFTILNNTKKYLYTSAVLIKFYNISGKEIGRDQYLGCSIDPKLFYTISSSTLLKIQINVNYVKENEIARVEIDFSIESRT